MEQGQGAQRFFISDQNPNDAIGGGGCLCSEGRCEDRGGPYAVFNHTETDSNLSPHVVICAPCVRGVAASLDGETLTAGQLEPAIDVEYVEVTQPERDENPVGEDEWPDHLEAI